MPERRENARIRTAQGSCAERIGNILSGRAGELDTPGDGPVERATLRPMARQGLGDIVRELREQRGLTQAQLADLAQLAVSYVALLESGQQRHPRPAILARLGRALGVPVSRFSDSEQSR